MRVAGTFSKGSLINASLRDVDARLRRQRRPRRLDGAILMTSAPGADPGAGQGRRSRRRSPTTPTSRSTTPPTSRAKAQHSVDQLLGIVTALLLLAVVVAILGIVNTLVLSVVERTRELGLLRAVGATRRQVGRRTPRVGADVAARRPHRDRPGHGLPASRSSRALVDEGITTVTVPAVTLAVYLVVAAVVGVLAAVGPARRASKVDVLRALTAE